MQLQPKSRRKRKDPESRDFICKCGKSYLSYAAAYTHVKNKHESQKQYLENIAKPQRQKLKRGRPKQRKQITSSKQTEALSIIQEAILKIYQQLKNGSDTIGKIVLQGNQQVSIQQLKKDYAVFCELKKFVYKLDFNLFQKPQKHPQLGLIVQFENKLNKHFTSTVASKLRWFLNLIVCKRILMLDKKKSSEKQNDKQKDIVESILLFEGAQGINQIVINALSKWTQAMQKAKQDQNQEQQSKSKQLQNQEQQQQEEDDN